MISFEYPVVWGLEQAIRGMRNPLNSWDKSDSGWGDYDCENNTYNYILGPEDLKLCQRLILGGPEHRKFLRQIIVSMDITAPLYWWKEFDTYKVGTVANSCSTMHTIHKKEFTLDDFSCEHLGFWDPELPEEEQPYKDMTIGWSGEEGTYPIDVLTDVVSALNKCRELYLLNGDKKYWWQLIQLLPSSYNQKRTVTLNYENLRSMYFQRRNHKLDEWHGFCKFITAVMPYAKELIIFTKEDKEDSDGTT